MPNLSDTQAILLSTAAQRDNRSVFPLAPALKPSGGLAKALGASISVSLVRNPLETPEPPH